MAGPEKWRKFLSWCEGQGGEVLPITNEYERARVKHADGVFVVYEGKRGVSFSDSVAGRAWASFSRGEGFPLTKRHKRTKTENTVARLKERDGDCCWFCGVQFTSECPPTIEHLLSCCHGGKSNANNLVLACSPCNAHAGNSPIAKKVLLRERLRATQ